MFNWIKRLVGLETDDDPGGTDRVRGKRHSSATGHLFSKDSPALRKTSESASPRKKGKSGVSARPKVAANPDFDPYNTGKFDRGASWEKISKKQR